MSKDNIALLKDKDLLLNIIREIHARGVVGEEDSIICLILKVMLRYCLNASSISSNVVVSDKSGSGKDWLVHSLCSVLLSPDDYECYTHITEKVLAYHQKDWSGKVMHIQDPSFELLNCGVFKTLAEGKSKALTLSSDKSVKEIVISGKPVMIVTSVNISLNDESVRRWDICHLDASEKLTKAVIVSKLSYVKLSNVDSAFVVALKTGFKPCSVVIPFSDSLTGILNFALESRTFINKLLDYIRASSVLFQHQRCHDKDGNVIASWFDFELGFFVFRHLNDIIGLPLSGDELKLLALLQGGHERISYNAQDNLDSEYDSSSSSSNGGLYARSIIASFPRSRKWVYGHLDKLKGLGLVDSIIVHDNMTFQDIERYSVSERYFSLCKSNKIVFRSESFEQIKSLFKFLDIERKKLDLDSIFSDWLSRK